MSYELDHVHFAYGNGPAVLDDVSFSIAPGERIALLGANGSGKSSLLRLLSGLDFASTGRINAFGQPLTEQSLQNEQLNHAFRRRVGLVFQNPDVQLFNATVFDELAFGPLQLGWPAQDIQLAIDRCLAQFGISRLKDRPPHRLSGGEKKRVAIASVLISKPDVLLLDEPTNALDPESRTLLVDMLIDSARGGRTLVTATHDLDIVQAIASRVIILDHGRVAADGPAQIILQDVELLRRTHLLQSHWHVTPDGMVRSHHHDHKHSSAGPAADYTLKI